MRFIVAVGARQTITDLPPGTAPERAATAAELLSGGYNQTQGSALVFDEVGGYEAIGAAEFLLQQGADVTFVTSLDSFAPQMMAIGVGVPAMQRLQATGRFRLLTQGESRFGRDGYGRGCLQGRMAGLERGRGNPGDGYRPGAGPDHDRRFHPFGLPD